ncbi:MAG: NADPH-dependent FMN reductase [Burkholderiaceae bacterium]|jgi:FMN reductase
MTVLTLAGSPARQSRSNALLRHTRRLLESRGFPTASIGLRDIPAEDLIEARYQSPAARIVRAKIDLAAAVILATPIYKASMGGGLKSLLDLLPQDALAGKVVLPLATGGTASHLLALEYSLKPVLSALGARNILGGIYAIDSQVSLTEEGEALLDPQIATRVENAIEELALELALLKLRNVGSAASIQRQATILETLEPDEEAETGRVRSISCSV